MSDSLAHLTRAAVNRDIVHRRATQSREPGEPLPQHEWLAGFHIMVQRPRGKSYESGITGFVYARAGERDKALAAARALESRSYVPAEGVSAIYAGLGDKDAALTWLERAVEARSVGLIFLAAESMYHTLREEPRYRRVVERLKLG